MWRASLLVAVVGCASTRAPFRTHVDEFFAQHPTSVKNPPNVLGVGPWTLGRWATYRTGPRSFDRVTVVAMDGCGTWIDAVSLDDVEQRRLLVCVRPSDSSDPFAIVREVRYQGGRGLPLIEVDTNDRVATRELLGPLVAKLVDPARAATIGGEAHELVQWADGATNSVVSSIAKQGVNLYFEPVQRARSSFSLGLSIGYLGGSSRFDGDTITAAAIGSGLAITDTFEVVGNVVVGGAPEAVTTMDQAVFAVALGARLRPLSPRLYLESDLGFAAILQQDTTAARGATMSWAIGGDVVLHRGWRASIEARERVLLLNNDEGLRHSFVVGWVLGLDLR